MYLDDKKKNNFSPAPSDPNGSVLFPAEAHSCVTLIVVVSRPGGGVKLT